jgi:uncharacterized protein
MSSPYYEDMPEQEPTQEGLRALHAEVDAAAAALAAEHAERLQCRRGCAACCVDELTVFEVEAERIRRHAPALLAEGAPHPPGACAFLDPDGACRIYEARPYVCRTQGLPLRWLDEAPDGALVEYRDICSLNDGGRPLETLDPTACWSIGPVEVRLQALQREATGDLVRVALRELFAT